MIRSTLVIRCAVFASLYPPFAAAQSRLEGTVTDEARRGLPGIHVLVEPLNRTAVTDENGRFWLDDLPPGPQLVTLSGRGYVPWQETVLLTGAPATLTVALRRVQTTVEVREPIDDFLATESVSVTKSPQQLLDLPYAVQVLLAALLETRASQDIKDISRNISGITDSTYSAMTFRGFTQREILFHGVRGNPYGSFENDINDAGFSTSQGRLSNVEFIEVLKGPAALLFGAGEPGASSTLSRKSRVPPPSRRPHSVLAASGSAAVMAT